MKRAMRLRRYYVSSLPVDPVVLASAGRGHWGIENSLHYVLDVVYRESKDSIKSRVKQMAWSDDYLERLLGRYVVSENQSGAAWFIFPGRTAQDAGTVHGETLRRTPNCLYP
jgi:hypothetical protein